MSSKIIVDTLSSNVLYHSPDMSLPIYEPSKRQLEQDLRLHLLWVYGLDGGKRLSLVRHDLLKVKFDSCNLSRADFSHSNLIGASFLNSTLVGTKFHFADLRGCKFSDLSLDTDLVVIYGTSMWEVFITSKSIQIGCQIHSVEEWEQFSKREIDDMDAIALDFWKDWKKPILSISKTLQKRFKE